MKLTGQVCVKRTEHGKDAVHKAVESVLKQGHILGIFPEGTRSHNGEIAQPFTGVAKYAIKHQVPVLPVGVHGTFEVLSRHDKRPKLQKIVKLLVGEPIHLHKEYENATEEQHFVDATHRVMLRVAELAGKKYEHHLMSKEYEK